MQIVEGLKIRFGGEDTIEVETLSECLRATVCCLEIIADQTLCKGDHCKFIVENVQRGSFELFISVLKDVAETIALHITIGAGIVTIFTGIAKLRKHLKGKKPVNVEDVDNEKQITNVDGDVETISNNIFNIYVTNSDLENAFARMSRALDSDQSRTSLTIEERDENGNIIEAVEYSEDDLRKTSDVIDVSSLSELIDTSSLTTSAAIKRPCLRGETQWEMILAAYGSRTLLVDVEDREFLSRVQAGDISFSAKTRIDGKFIIRTQKDNRGNIVGRPKVSLIQVVDVNEAKGETEQISIDDIE